MDDFDNPPASSTSTLQWIISLAISVICCASLFVVMAFYITDQHVTISNVALRMDLLQQRQDRLTNEIETMKRSAPPRTQSLSDTATPAATTAVPAETGAVAAPKPAETPAAAPAVPADATKKTTTPEPPVKKEETPAKK